MANDCRVFCVKMNQRTRIRPHFTLILPARKIMNEANNAINANDHRKLAAFAMYPMIGGPNKKPR